jgi:hypothetical protein
MQTGYVVKFPYISDGRPEEVPTFLVGKTLYNDFGSGTNAGKKGSIDMALAHFTNEAQINSMNGQTQIGTGWIIEAQLESNANAGELVVLVNLTNTSAAARFKRAINSDARRATSLLGICLIGGAADDFTQILIKGFYCTSEATYYDNPSSKGAGVPLYIGATEGEVTSNAPTASGSYVRIVGNVWRSQQGTGSGSSTIIYFNPQNVFTYIE